MDANATTIFTAVITSTVVAAVIAGAFDQFGRKADRTARKRELLLTTATQLAMADRADALSLLKSGTISKLTLEAPGTLIESYYEALEHMFKAGRMPESLRASIAEKMAALKENDR